MIDQSLHNDLRQRFNPDGSELREFQLRLLEIFKYIDRICVKNGIKYFASSGTCIGAIRHEGFIPWDDDIDIEMTLSEYRRFRKAVLKDNDPRFKLWDHSTDPEYVTQFAKIVDSEPFPVTNRYESFFTRYQKYKGPFVDIFILAPSNSKKISRFSAYFQSVLLFRLNHIRNGAIRRTLKRINYAILTHIIFPLFRLILLPGAKTTMRHVPGVEYPIARDITDFENTIRVKFENLQIPVPQNYDRYLRRIYGDYMVIPNLDKIRCHTIKVTTNP